MKPPKAMPSGADFCIEVLSILIEKELSKDSSLNLLYLIFHKAECKFRHYRALIGIDKRCSEIEVAL